MATRGERDSEAIRRERASGASAIRRELARHFVNPNLLRIVWTSSGVQLSGRLEKQWERMRTEGISSLDGSDITAPVNSRFLRSLDQAIREAANAKQIDWRLEGWLCAGGEFIPLG